MYKFQNYPTKLKLNCIIKTLFKTFYQLYKYLITEGLLNF